jgi:hypothetical protein
MSKKVPHVNGIGPFSFVAASPPVTLFCSCFPKRTTSLQTYGVLVVKLSAITLRICPFHAQALAQSLTLRAQRRIALRDPA